MIPTIFTIHKEPRLTLVGAGPGDPDLITLKGVKAIKAADVVLYDALVSAEILALIPDGTPNFAVGKRAGQHSYTQDEINELIVELAFAYGHVVRLKGGDPFVFGRGSEEMEFASRHGVVSTVVPGVSSAIAVPGALNIPVTARGVSESFWVVTATTKSGKISGDIALAAQSSATIIILMGMSKVEEIATILSQHGKGETPVAVIQNGTMPNQRSIVGTVANISELTRVADLRSPGIIIVGEVVRFAKELNKIIDFEVLKNYE
jgi:uroporphyrin-III C-methyltransferase